MKKLFLTLSLVLCAFVHLYAQIAARVLSAAQNPVAFATVDLLRADDSVVVRSTRTDSSGLFRIDVQTIPPGNYRLRVSSIGYAYWSSAVFPYDSARPGKELGPIYLAPVRSQLGQVVIRGSRPPIQSRADGTIVQVDASLMSRGSSALDVLERSPGVFVDRQHGDILLNGKAGVSVMIDGKPIRMSPDQLAALLGGLSANDILRIELLSNPSAAQDAEGSAGIINIVLKKNKLPGTAGSVSLTAGYGYREKGAASVSLSHNAGTSHLYGSYSFSHDYTYSDFHATGSEDEPLLGGNAQSDFFSRTASLQNNHNALAGFDKKISPRLTLGASLQVNSSRSDNQTFNQGRYRVADSTATLAARVDGLNPWHTIAPSLFLEKQVNDRTRMTIGADYIRYKNRYPIDATSSFLTQSGQSVNANDTLLSPLQKGSSHTQINLGALKFDYEKRIGEIWSYQAGIKGTVTRTTSFSAIESYLDGNYVSRPAGVSHIAMNEGIGAAYLTGTVKAGPHTTLTAGLRYEYSDTRVTNVPDNTPITERKFGEIFPNLLLVRETGPAQRLSLSFGRRISRPSFSDLASYVTYNGPGSVNTGNPLLKPGISTNFKIGYSIKSYSLSLLFSHDKDPIVRDQSVYSADHLQLVIAPQNMIFQDNVQLQSILPFSVGAWWKMNYTLAGGWRRFRLGYTPVPAGKTYPFASLQSSQQFTLPAAWSAEVSGYYQTGFYNGSRKVNGYGVLNAAVKKELTRNQGSLQLAVSDILRSNYVDSYFGALTTEAFHLDTHVRFHSESSKWLIVKLSYTRSFGGNGSTGRKAPAPNEESERIR